MLERENVVPLLVIRGARAALDWYVRALGARVVACYEHGPQRLVSHADLTFGDALVSVTEEARAWNSDAPTSLGGSAVVLQLRVDDVDGCVERARELGATVVFPPQELLGERMARVRDPYGHLWILRTELEELSGAEIQRLRDQLVERALQSASAPPTNGPSLRENSGSSQEVNAGLEYSARGRVFLVLGPVGAGKTTFARTLARQRRALRLTLDEWIAVLFRPDRPREGLIPWYRERAERCVAQIWATAVEAQGAGVDVILEIGLLTRQERAAFFARVCEAGVELEVYVLNASRQTRWARVERRNVEQGATFSAVVPEEIFDLASDAWQPVDEAEFEGVTVHFLPEPETRESGRPR